jgi:hypothetical protein
MEWGTKGKEAARVRPSAGSNGRAGFQQRRGCHAEGSTTSSGGSQIEHTPYHQFLGCLKGRQLSITRSKLTFSWRALLTCCQCSDLKLLIDTTSASLGFWMLGHWSSKNMINKNMDVAHDYCPRCGFCRRTVHGCRYPETDGRVRAHARACMCWGREGVGAL